MKSNCDNLRKMLRKKEKESEEKDREITSLNQVRFLSKCLRKKIKLNPYSILDFGRW